MDYVKFIRTEGRVLTDVELAKINHRIDEINEMDETKHSAEMMELAFVEAELITLAVTKSLQRLEARESQEKRNRLGFKLVK